MKRALLILSPICLGVVCGIALVVACNSTSKSSAQTQSGHSVVDSAGTVLGALIGTGPGFSSTYDANGTATPVLEFPTGQVHTFLDANSRVWNVFGNGSIAQPVASVYYVTANCSGTAYIEQGDPKVVLRHAGSYWVRSGAASSITPLSRFPAGSPAGTCEPYPPPGSTVTTISATTASSLVAVTPPTFVPPVTIN